MINSNYSDPLISSASALKKSRSGSLLNQRNIFFGVGLVCFLFMAVLGWIKLKYGFNFIDEGMYMTDGWRMAVGDRLFPDNSTNALFLYTVFNEYIFKLSPDITLYGFRKLQYCAAIFAMLLLAISLFRWTRDFWYLPYVLALFAFTGLDVNGMASNLSYYVYPHFFITLHLAFLIFALQQRQGFSRDFLLALSGICLWGVGFSLLPLVFTLISPVILWLLFSRLPVMEYSFSVRDVSVLYAPVVLAWGGFLAINGMEFIDATYNMYGYSTEVVQSKFKLFASSIPYLFISLLLVGTLILNGRRRDFSAYMVSVAVSVAIFFAIDSNVFGFVPPFWQGWFNTQMWFSSLVVAICLIVTGEIIYRCWKDQRIDGINQLLIVLIVPSIVMACLFAYFSSLGPMTVQFVSIPVTLALAVFVVRWARGSGRALLILVLTLSPFYYSMARADWKFTYFDLPPHMLNSTLHEGFSKGIRTNQLYSSMASWMQSMSRKYSREGDFAIVTEETPMGYMLIKRRPSLNHSWVGLGGSMSLKRDSVGQMIRDKREPKIAFRFATAPLYFPNDAQGSTYVNGTQRQIDPGDPVDDYLLHNMKHIGNFVFGEQVWIELYVR